MYSLDNLKLEFEKAYSEFHTGFHREEDPVQFAHLYEHKKDQEIVAFLSALFSYGNRKQIIQSLKKLFMQMGASPYDFLLSYNSEKKLNFVHRFSTSHDLHFILLGLKQFLAKSESLQFYFEGFGPQTPVKEILQRFKSDFFSDLSGSGFRKRYLDFLISDPTQNSCCKRLNLFLRWVARPADGIDLGLWENFGTDRLLLPVDTHLFKLICLLGWTPRKTPSWKTVEEVTLRLREMNPQDPIRYDFSLCHLSMTGNLQRFVKGLKEANEKVERRSLYKKSAKRKLRGTKHL